MTEPLPVEPLPTPDASIPRISFPGTPLLVILLSAAALVVAWAAFTLWRAPAVGVFHDDGVYLVTAKALASGDGYRIISLPGSPYQTKYPILFPFLLSLVWRAAPAFPDNLTWLRLIPLAASGWWLVLAWRVMRETGASTATAALALALTAASPWSIFLSTTLLSETLFAAFVAAALLLLIRTDSSAGRYGALAAGALMGAAVLTRAVGIAAAFGGVIYLVTSRRWKAVGQYLFAVCVAAVPWFAWSFWHAGDPIIDSFYSGANYQSWNIVFNYSWQEKLAILGVNAFWATQFGQFWGLPLGTWPAWFSAAVCTFWIGRGLWLERRSAVVLVCLCYLALLLAWAFPPVRFMVPILPFLARYLFVGAGRLRPAAFAVAGVLTLSATLATGRVAQTSAGRGGTWFDASGVDDWKGIERLIQWVDDHTSPDAILIATHDPTFFLFTGRQAVRPDSMEPLALYYNISGRRIDPAVDAELFRQRVIMAGADYVIVTPRDAPAKIDLLVSRFPGSFTIVEGSRESGHAVYRIDRGRLTGP